MDRNLPPENRRKEKGGVACSAVEDVLVDGYHGFYFLLPVPSLSRDVLGVHRDKPRNESATGVPSEHVHSADKHSVENASNVPWSVRGVHDLHEENSVLPLVPRDQSFSDQ